MPGRTRTPGGKVRRGPGTLCPAARGPRAECARRPVNSGAKCARPHADPSRQGFGAAAQLPCSCQGDLRGASRAPGGHPVQLFPRPRPLSGARETEIHVRPGTFWEGPFGVDTGSRATTHLLGHPVHARGVVRRQARAGFKRPRDGCGLWLPCPRPACAAAPVVRSLRGAWADRKRMLKRHKDTTQGGAGRGWPVVARPGNPGKLS